MVKELMASPQHNFFLLAGPCVIEGEEMALDIAEKAMTITSKLGIPYVFKGSYRKANRSRIDSFTGIGDEKALKILRKVGETFGIPVVTDIHEPVEADIAAEYVDVLQIPAFLCRQTELLVATAHTGRMVNIKKGQFLAPESMRFAVQKVRDAGNDEVTITERGTTFGYQSGGGLPRCARDAGICPRHCGHHSFPAAAQPGWGSDWWPPRTHRDDGTCRHRHWSRWSVP